MKHEDKILSEIELIKNKGMSVCIFGAGRFGSGLAYDIVKSFGVRVHFYCDNAPALWGNIIRDDIVCVSPTDILEKEIEACFVFIGSKTGMDDVVKQIERFNFKIIITLSELLGLSNIVKDFLDGKIISEQMPVENERFNWNVDMVKKNRVHNNSGKECAVFTCITGNYDHVNEPGFCSDACDYYLISDENPGQLDVMQWIDINTVVPDKVTDNIRRNRFCKINAPYIFSEYKYSVYIDGTIEISGDLNQYISKTGKSGIAIFKHPERNCIYSEAIACGVRKADSFSKIYTQVMTYLKEGMPYDYGLFECTILVRDNSNPACRKLMLDWWNEVFNWSYRDQLSFTYCLWKNGLKSEDVGMLGENYRTSGVFRRVRNHQYKY
ncbi:MAG: DUF616 domain-containing protein [Roseburia sp.]|nr:DUF616 domain-containing protein [Roseburia sp.]MCM1201650.1 DUF616 domain-containing protein [Bacteroides fragilis]